MRKLYVGRKHRTKEIMLICINNDITAINPHTGEIWGRYHLDKTKNTTATNSAKSRKRTPKTKGLNDTMCWRGCTASRSGVLILGLFHLSKGIFQLRP